MNCRYRNRRPTGSLIGRTKQSATIADDKDSVAEILDIVQPLVRRDNLVPIIACIIAMKYSAGYIKADGVRSILIETYPSQPVSMLVEQFGVPTLAAINRTLKD